MSDKNHSSHDLNPDEHNQGGLIAFVFSMVFVLAFFVYIVAIHPGVDLKENIHDVPVAGAEVAVDLSKITEPWVANQDLVNNGKKLFAQNCAMCHGNEGKGDGPAGLALNPPPRNLVEGPWKKGGGFVGLYTVISEGLPGSAMVSFGHFPAVDRWSLVQFVNSFTNAKVEEDAAQVATFAKTAK